MSTYFRRNKVKDATIKKAVEVALDLGGADTIARKEIKNFYGDKVLKSKEVQQALQYANEETINEIFGISQDPRYRAKVMKMLDDEGIKYKKDGRNALIILGVAPKDQKKLLDRIHKEFGMSSYNIIDEGTLSEGKNLMPDIQKIVDTKGAAKVGGIMVDMFTASMISQIYGKVNDSNKKKMEKSNISTLVDLAQRMMQKMGDNLEEARITISTPMYNELQKFGLPKLMKKHDA